MAVYEINYLGTAANHISTTHHQQRQQPPLIHKLAGQFGYNIMATENQLKVYPCSEKMKCLVGDYLKNSGGSLLFDDSAFLLFLSRSRQADLSIMNRQFTAITQNHRIRELQYLSCCSYIKKDRHFIFIYANKNKITVLKFVEKDEGFEPATELCSLTYGFEGNDDDGFKFISKPFSINEGDAVLAYSEKDEFYLISLSERGRMVSLEVAKLVDQQRSSGIWSWLTRQKSPHYESVKIVPICSMEDDSYRFLCVRDNTATILQVFVRLEEKNKSSLKQLYVCSSLPASINSECSLVSAHLISQDLALLAYSSKGKTVLIKLSIINEEGSLTIEKINTYASAAHLQVLQCKEHVYFSFKDTLSLKYKCLKFGNSLKEITNAFQSIQPVFQTKNPIWLCGNSKELFLVNTYNVYQIEQANQDVAVPEQERKLKSFEGWIERTINKKIQKQTHLRNYVEVEALLEEKELKLTEQYNHLKKGGIQPKVQIEICHNILCTYIVKSLLSKSDYFARLLSYIQHPNIELQLRDMNQSSLIDNLLARQSPVQIQCALIIMVKTEMYAYLNEILEDVTKHPLKDISQDIIQTIFAQVCSNTIHDFQIHYKNRSISEHKILMEFTFKLIKVNQTEFIDDFLHLVNIWSNDEATFARNLVLNVGLAQIFMQLFIRSKRLLFSAEQVKEMVGNMAEDVRQDYLTQFFQKLKEAYVDSVQQDRRRVLMKNGAALVKGLQSYQNEIEGILRDNFPGLLAYVYLNSANKKEYKGQLLDIADNCTSPAAAYMLVLANPLDDRKEWKQQLAKIRLCIDLDVSYSNQADILLEIQHGRYDKKAISSKKWEAAVKSLQIPKERADKLAEMLTLV